MISSRIMPRRASRIATVPTGTAIMAAPVSYEIGGEQYVAVLAGFGGGAAPMYERGVVARERENHGRIFAFKLGGTAVPLPPKRSAGETPELAPLAFYSDSLAERGSSHFRNYCVMCHAGRGDDEPGAYPQLVRMNAATHAAFDSIVLGGKLASAGMASFADVLGPRDVQAIRAFLWREQRTLRQREQRSRLARDSTRSRERQ